jgi:hypothetical protein
MKNNEAGRQSLDTQKAKIKEALDAGAILDPHWAWSKIGCSKLSTRLGEMIRDGMIPPVHRYRKVTKDKSFTIYSRKKLKEYEKTAKLLVYGSRK